MSAKDTVKRNKTAIQATLTADRKFILNKVYEKKLITQREYNNLRSINKENEEGHVTELVDKLMNKGEDACQTFLNVLQTDEDIRETFPGLRDIQLNDSTALRLPVQASSPLSGSLTHFSHCNTASKSVSHNCPEFHVCFTFSQVICRRTTGRR